MTECHRHFGYDCLKKVTEASVKKQPAFAAKFEVKTEEKKAKTEIETEYEKKHQAIEEEKKTKLKEVTEKIQPKMSSLQAEVASAAMRQAQVELDALPPQQQQQQRGDLQDAE